VLLPVYQQAYKSATLLGITQESLKQMKNVFLKCTSGITQESLKQMKNMLLKCTSYLTMEKTMVHGLSIPLAHTTPIHHNDMSLPKVVPGKNIF
jgi:hypothetical protein